MKTVTVNAYTLPSYNAIALANEVDKILAKDSNNWPIGYMYELGGEIESSGKANASLGAKFPIAFLIIILLLVGQFDSIRRPLIDKV